MPSHDQTGSDLTGQMVLYGIISMLRRPGKETLTNALTDRAFVIRGRVIKALATGCRVQPHMASLRPHCRYVPRLT